jgi:hypothetical protein
MKNVLVAVGVCLLSAVNVMAQWVACTGGSSQTCTGASVAVGTITPSPVSILTIKQSGIYPAINVQEVSSTNRRATIGFGIDSGVTSGWVLGESLSQNQTRDFYLYDIAASQTRLLVDTSGNVGIGTLTPGAKLDVGAGVTPRGGYTDLLIGPGPVVQSQSKPQIELYAPSASAAINYDGSHFSIFTGGVSWVDALDIDNAGNAHVSGSLTVSGSITGASVIGATYQDVAEWVPASGNVPPGTVVVLNRERNNEVIPSTRAYDPAVAGVVSSNPGVILGSEGASKAKIATTGRVRVRVDASRHAIHIGDLLVTSDNPGVAMVSEPLDLDGVKIHRPGTLIGKALEPLSGGQGEILVLLSLQ